jgi:hypothetical protein
LKFHNPLNELFRKIPGGTTNKPLTFFLIGVLVGIILMASWFYIEYTPMNITGTWEHKESKGTMNLMVFEDNSCQLYNTVQKETFSGKVVELDRNAYKLEIGSGESLQYFRLQMVDKKTMEFIWPDGKITRLNKIK